MSAIVCACGSRVPTRSEWAGQWITCPGCGGSLYAPFPGDKPSVPASASPTRLCALCAETIPVADATCRYCGSDPTGARPAAPPPQQQPASSTDEGLPALIVGILGLMFCQFLCPVAWVLGSNYMSRCRARGVEPSSTGNAGRIIGMVGTILLVLGIAAYVLVAVISCL